MYHPDPRRKAIVEGRKVIDKYACAECHTLELERWTLGGKVELSGTPRLDRHGALLEDEDDDGRPVHYFTLWSPAVIAGHVYPVGGADVSVSPLLSGEGQGVRGWNRLTAIRPPWGGALARLLYPAVGT